MSDSANESRLGKLGWVIVTTMVGSLVAIPISYFGGIFSSAATLSVSLVRSEMEGSYNNFVVRNESVFQPAKSVVVEMAVYKQFVVVGSHAETEDYPGAKFIGDPLCTKTSVMHAVVVFECSLINPHDTRAFSIDFGTSKPDFIEIHVVYEGHTIIARYDRPYGDESAIYALTKYDR